MVSAVETLSTQRIPVPDSLTRARAREIWVEIVNSHSGGYFRPSDEHLLKAYCVAATRYEEADAEIEKHGLVLVDERGKKSANPAVQILLALASSMAQLAVKLRLCPSARYTKGEKPQKGIAGGGVRPWDEGQVA